MTSKEVEEKKVEDLKKVQAIEKLEKKEFSFDTIQNFDNHINTSIPCYDEIVKCIEKFSEYFIVDNTSIYDIGCSTGTLLKKINTDRYKGVKKIGIDSSLNLLPKNTQNISFIDYDLRDEFLFTNASIISSVFTLQFLPQSKRFAIIKNIYQGLIKGGAFFFCEKIYSSYAKIQDMFTFNYYDFKAKTFSAEEILNKEKSLRYLMQPCTHEENISMLKEAGFNIFDIFIKHFNFEGIVAIK